MFRIRNIRRLSDAGVWNLEPEVRSALANRLDQELAKRSMSGALVYFVVTVVLAISTPYYVEHPAVILLAGFLTLLTGGVRMVAGWRLLKQPADVRNWTKPVFLSATYATFVVWGWFCGWTLHLYADRWIATFLLLSTAALAGGTSSSLAPSVQLAARCLVLLISPTIVAACLMGSAQYLGFAVVTTVYLGFLIAQSRGNSREFWTASVAAERERIRGSADRKKAEMQRASLVASIEQAVEEILITDTDGNIQYCNQAFERCTGYARNEVVGRNPRFLKSGKHDAEFYRAMWDRIRSGGVWSGRFTNRRKDGSLYQVEGTISPILDGDKIAGFVSARRDVTERLRMEAQLRQAQKMESIGRLAGGVAHDFNNLLTVIVGYCTCLEEALEAEDPNRQYVEEIQRAAEQAASLTKQLLAFGRKQLVAPKPVDLNVLVVDTRRMLQRLVGEDVEILVDTASPLGLVCVDPAQMIQILMNLAANGRDAMPGGGKLKLTTGNVPAGAGPADENPILFAGPTVLLSVNDTGAGIDEETRQHIFEPFFSTKDRGRGTGLGLSTVYGIVQQNGGFISVHTEPGRGTTFQIFFPRFEGRIESGETATTPAGPIGGSETVLVVEDQEEVRRLMISALRSYGFHVLEAADGTAALEEAANYSGPIHLLLTDVIMPDMTGRDVAERLTPVRPAMKVLYISGYSGEVIADRGVLKANVAYLPKPFTPAALVSKVRQVLSSGE